MLITLLLYVPSRRGRECFVRAAHSGAAARAERDRPDAARRAFFVNEDYSRSKPMFHRNTLEYARARIIPEGIAPGDFISFKYCFRRIRYILHIFIGPLNFQLLLTLRKTRVM